MSFASNNVVSLYGDTDTQTSLNSAQVANITAAVKSIATMHLTMLLRTMFAELDDTLFSVCDEIDNENKKAYHYDEIVELRLKNKQIEILFIKRFEELFSQSLLFSPLDSSAKTEAVSRSRRRRGGLQNFLEIDETELESSIMLTHFVAKANKMFKDKIDYMQTGFDSLLKSVAIGGRSNPVSPALIGDAFKVSMESLDKNSIHKSIVYDHFDQGVMQKLGEMYDQINALFTKVGAN